MKISVVVTTYNRPQALRLVLNALLAQRQAPFEILIADDGSADPTRYLIRQMAHQAAVPIHHLWQADDGFRAAAARNLAVAAAQGDLVIFLDGDCVPRPTSSPSMPAWRNRAGLCRAVACCWAPF